MSTWAREVPSSCTTSGTRANDAVNKATKDLENCRSFKKVGDNTPACVEEKKNLEKARRRLEFCEQKEAITRRWKPVIEQQFRETCVRLVHFHEVTDVRCPKAMAVVERMLKALDAYRAATSPAGADAAAGAGSAASVARQADDEAAAPPPPDPAGGRPREDQAAGGDA